MTQNFLTHNLGCQPWSSSLGRHVAVNYGSLSKVCRGVHEISVTHTCSTAFDDACQAFCLSLEGCAVLRPCVGENDTLIACLLNGLQRCMLHARHQFL